MLAHNIDFGVTLSCLTAVQNGESLRNYAAA